MNAKFSTRWVEPGYHGYRPHLTMSATGNRMAASGIHCANTWYPWQPDSTYHVGMAVYP